MTLAEKFAGLTPEQKEKFLAVKTPEELEPFLAVEKIELTEEERKSALEYLTTGAVALGDDDLAAVAGGGLKPVVHPAYKICPNCGGRDFSPYGGSRSIFMEMCDGCFTLSPKLRIT